MADEKFEGQDKCGRPQVALHIHCAVIEVMVRRACEERDAEGVVPYRCGGKIFRLPNLVVTVGLFLRRANGVRPYDFVAVGFRVLAVFIQFSSYVRGVTLGIMP